MHSCAALSHLFSVDTPFQLCSGRKQSHRSWRSSLLVTGKNPCRRVRVSVASGSAAGTGVSNLVPAALPPPFVLVGQVWCSALPSCGVRPVPVGEKVGQIEVLVPREGVAKKHGVTQVRHAVLSAQGGT